MENGYNRSATPNRNDTIDIAKLARQLFNIRNIVIMIAVGVIFGAAAFSYSRFVLPEKFTASVSMYVYNENTRTTEDKVDQGAITTSRTLADSYVIILKNDIVMEEVGKELLKIYSPEELGEYFPISEANGVKYVKGKYINSCFSIAPVNETEILEVTVTTENPQLSADMCNEMTVVAPDFLKRVIGAGSVEAIGSAVPPEAKSYPNNTANATKGFMLGVVLVIAVLCVIILMDTKIRDGESFKEKFDLPVLGEIPLIASSESDHKNKKGKSTDNTTYVAAESFQATEAFNALCNNLMVTLSMNDENVIVVSSPEMSDGKSTVSINLAKTMANMGKKVILMDMDLRRPSIHKKLKLKNKNGINNLMCKTSDIEQVINKNISENLDVVVTGGISPNPSEMLGSKRMASIVEYCRENYDYVIIDSTPVNVVTDACIISKLAAGIVVVIRANETRFDDVKRTIENVEMSRCKILGVT